MCYYKIEPAKQIAAPERQQGERTIMTEERKKEIFNKEYLTPRDLREILGLRTRQYASLLLQKIKQAVNSECTLKGKMWTKDFFKYYKIKVNADGEFSLPKKTTMPRERLIDGRKLRIARKKKGLTLDELSSISGVHTTNIYLKEMEKQNALPETVEKLVKALGISVDDITRDEILKERERERKRELAKENGSNE